MDTREFCERFGLHVTLRVVDSNPQMSGRMDPGAHHYRATLRSSNHKRRMTVPFSTGSGWKRDPDVADIVDCLASDASVDGQSFESWAGDLGYDADSREAERTFKACVRQTKKLRVFLSPDEGAWQMLMDAERL